MNKKLSVLVLVAALLVVTAIPAFADGPNFGPVIYADDELWGTKGTAALPAPNGNEQAYDGLYKFSGAAAEGQRPVAEAAPGNPAYNGGRWIEYFVTWNVTPELVTSFAQLQALADAGDVTISAPSGAYFQCPLLPMKG